MKKAILLGLLLAGCQSIDEKNWIEAQRYCQLPGSTKPAYDYKQCVDDNFRAYSILSRYTPPASPAPATVYYPQQTAAAPASDAPVLQNIIPPTVRCQSVPAGMGTVQTICR